MRSVSLVLFAFNGFLVATDAVQLSGGKIVKPGQNHRAKAYAKLMRVRQGKDLPGSFSGEDAENNHSEALSVDVAGFSFNGTSESNNQASQSVHTEEGWEHLLDDASIETSSKYRPPIMMFAHGCATTTAGIHTLQALLKAHGEDSTFMRNAELIKALDETHSAKDFQTNFANVENRPDVAKALGSAKNLFDKVKIITNFAKSDGLTLTFKNELNFALAEKGLMKYLKSFGVRTFLYTRFNTIDVIKCRVTDFCDEKGNEEIGYPVNKNGKRTACRFRGREHVDSKVGEQVWLDPKSIAKALQWQKDKDNEHRDYMNGNHPTSADIGRWDYKEFAAEHLMGFEFGKDFDEKGLKRSTHRWTKLLETLGVANADRKTVRKVLKKLDEYPPPKNHKDSISNYDEIKAALKGTEFEDMLREYDHVSYADSLSLNARRKRYGFIGNATDDKDDDDDDDDYDDKDDEPVSDKLVGDKLLGDKLVGGMNTNPDSYRQEHHFAGITSKVQDEMKQLTGQQSEDMAKSETKKHKAKHGKIWHERHPKGSAKDPAKDASKFHKSMKHHDKFFTAESLVGVSSEAAAPSQEEVALGWAVGKE